MIDRINPRMTANDHLIIWWAEHMTMGIGPITMDMCDNIWRESLCPSVRPHIHLFIRHPLKKRHGRMDRQTDRQTDRRTDGRPDRPTDRPTDKHTIYPTIQHSRISGEMYIIHIFERYVKFWPVGFPQQVPNKTAIDIKTRCNLFRNPFFILYWQGRIYMTKTKTWYKNRDWIKHICNETLIKMRQTVYIE